MVGLYGGNPSGKNSGSYPEELDIVGILTV
jgi:hypothetical protein